MTIAEVEIKLQELQNQFTRLEQSLNKAKISELVSADTINDTDIIPIVQGGVTKRITKQTLLAGLSLELAADKGYDTIAERDAHKAELKNGENIFVQDASGDPTVDTGWAVYRFDQVNDTFYKLAEQEGVDFTLTDYLKKTNNLSELTDKGAARTSLDVYSTTEVNNKISATDKMLKIRTAVVNANTLVTFTDQEDANYYVEIVDYIATGGTVVVAGWQITNPLVGAFNFIPPARYSTGTLNYRLVNKY